MSVENSERSKGMKELSSSRPRVEGVEEGGVRDGDTVRADEILDINRDESNLAETLRSISYNEAQLQKEELRLIKNPNNQSIKEGIKHLKEVIVLYKEILTFFPNHNLLEGINPVVIEKVNHAEKLTAEAVAEVSRKVARINAIISAVIDENAKFFNYDFTSDNKQDDERIIQLVENETGRTVSVNLFSEINNLFADIDERLSVLETEPTLSEAARIIAVEETILEVSRGLFESIKKKEIVFISRRIKETMVEESFSNISDEQRNFSAEITRKKQDLDLDPKGYCFQVLSNFNYVRPNDVEIQPDNTGKDSEGAQVREAANKLTKDITDKILLAESFIEKLEDVKTMTSLFGKKSTERKKINALVLNTIGDYERLYADTKDTTGLSADLGSGLYHWNLESVTDIDQYIDTLIGEQKARIDKGKKIIDYISTFSERIDETQDDEIKRALLGVRLLNVLEEKKEQFIRRLGEEST